jgi:phosphatidate cytidylyltransferase
MGGEKGILLGVAVAVAAPLGDLFESKIKRDAGTKDAGTLFGPHGGALDRLDAAFFSLVAGYYVWLLLL